MSLTAPGDSDSPTAALARFAAQTGYQDLPASVVREVKRCLLDYLGLVIGASDEPAVARALAATLELGGQPQASVLLTVVKTSIHNAAIVNGVASHVLDDDDTRWPTIVRPTGPPMTVALAVGEWQQASGKELIAAFAVGFEVACRAGLAIQPERYDEGRHVTGTAGRFGAAATAGRLLGLDPRQMRWALGMAGAQAAGRPGPPGSMARSLQVGKTAGDGLLGALLARHGFDATEQVFEDQQGFNVAPSSGQHLQRLTDRLGETWELRVPPVSDDDLRDKVHDLVWPFLPRWKEQRLHELIGGLEHVEDVGVFAELLTPDDDQ